MNFPWNSIIGLQFLFNNLSLLVCGYTVTLPQGRVRGTNNFIHGYRSFLGIPYATVKNRYQEAGDPPTWNGTFKADTETTCKQFSQVTRSIIGTESCLTANVYTPSKRHPELLPVIVFMHGGGFYWGSNTNMLYNPKYLVEKKVVVVNINYRLGAFGFLCLKTKEAPGNVGMKDQVAALRWIRSNIEFFNGNPESVTLFGESAGASSTVFLILSQAAQGLFHRAIVHSGTVNTPHFFDRHPIQSAVYVAGRLGYNTTDTNELIKIFRNSSADDIVSASYVDSTNDALAPYTLMLCKEDRNVNENALITKNPREFLNSVKEVSNISIIMGYNDKEGIMWAAEYDSKGLENLHRNFTAAIPRSFTYDSAEDKELFTKAIKKIYFNNNSINHNGLIDYYSDVIMMYPSVLTMEAFLSNPKITLYNYYFTYDSIRNLNKLRTRLRFTTGAGHADELFYIFNPLIYQLVPYFSSDVDFIDTMTTLYTNFAKTGVPSSKSIEWTPSEDTLRFLKLGNKKINMVDLPNKDRINFWRRTEQKYGLHYP